MAASTIRINPADKARIKRALKMIPYEVSSKKLWLAIFRQTAKAFQNTARQAAPPGKTGQLKKSIKVFATRKSRQGPYVMVGPKLKTKGLKGKARSGAGAYYAPLVEKGHEIKKGGRTTAKPFMQIAWDQNKNKVSEETLRAAQKVVQKILTKHAKGGKLLYT